MTPLLEARGVTVRLGGRRVLDDVSLALTAGSVTVLIGPNGAGKSTLLATLAGDLAPEGGEVRLDGRDLRHWPSSALADRRAVLPQSQSLAFPYTVHELASLGLRGRPLDAGARAQLDAALARVELAGFGGRFVQQLSGGEQQRAHLARILCQMSVPDRRVILLDEPTASLDPRHQLLAIGIAREFAAAGGAVLAILHDLNLASLAADRIVGLRDGRVAAAGAPPEVLTAATLQRLFDVTPDVGGGPRPFVLPPGLMSSSHDA